MFRVPPVYCWRVTPRAGRGDQATHTCTNSGRDYDWLCWAPSGEFAVRGRSVHTKGRLHDVGDHHAGDHCGREGGGLRYAEEWLATAAFCFL